MNKNDFMFYIVTTITISMIIGLLIGFFIGNEVPCIDKG